MKKINIEIPDNLTQKQEVLAIAKQLSKKQLSEGGKIKNRIGDTLEVKYTQTEIIVTRTTTEKPIISCTCSMCETIFEQHLGKPVYHNYGGFIKKMLVCSSNCQDSVIDILGGRAAKSKRDIKNAFLW